MGMKKTVTAMKKVKAMKKSKSMIAKGKRAKSSVFHGTKTKTSGGLTKDKLMKNKNGRIVSKARSAAAKKRFASSPLKAWNQAIKAARKQLSITGFCPVNGKTVQGKALYAKAKSLL